MSSPTQLGSRARASMAMLAAALGAMAPVATVSPVAPGTPQVQTPSTARAPAAMTRTQTVRALQAIGIDPGFHGFRGGPMTSIHTFPAWNQRKARKRSRQTGRKIQKRYAR